MESIRLQPTYSSAAERKTTYISYHAKWAVVKRGKGKEREDASKRRFDDSMEGGDEWLSHRRRWQPEIPFLLVGPPDWVLRWRGGDGKIPGLRRAVPEIE